MKSVKGPKKIARQKEQEELYPQPVCACGGGRIPVNAGACDACMRVNVLAFWAVMGVDGIPNELPPEPAVPVPSQQPQRHRNQRDRRRR